MSLIVVSPQPLMVSWSWSTYADPITLVKYHSLRFSGKGYGSWPSRVEGWLRKLGRGYVSPLGLSDGFPIQCDYWSSQTGIARQAPGA